MSVENIEQPPQRESRRAKLILTIFLWLLVWGGLALVFTNCYGPMGRNDYLQRAEADLHTIETNLIRYKVRCREFPTTAQGLDALVSKPTIAPVPTNWAQLSEPEGIIDPWGNPYQYRFPARHNLDKPDVWSMGPDGKPGTRDDIGNW